MTFLYLPGLDGSGRLLFSQKQLLERHRVFCQVYPNERGHDYHSLADDAARRVEADNDGAPVTVLAESFGGGVAIDFAIRFPHLVERLVMVNTFAKYPVAWLPKLGRVLEPLCPSRPSPRWSRVLRNRFLFADDLPRDIRDRWWQEVSELKMSAMAHRIGLIAGLDRRADLPGIQTPTVVIVSTDDRLVAPRAGYELAERIPGAELVKTTGGHTVMSHPTFDLCDVLSKTKYFAEEHVVTHDA